MRRAMSAFCHSRVASATTSVTARAQPPQTSSGEVRIRSASTSPRNSRPSSTAISAAAMTASISSDGAVQPSSASARHQLRERTFARLRRAPPPARAAGSRVPPARSLAERTPLGRDQHRAVHLAPAARRRHRAPPRAPTTTPSAHVLRRVQLQLVPAPHRAAPRARAAPRRRAASAFAAIIRSASSAAPRRGCRARASSGRRSRAPCAAAPRRGRARARRGARASTGWASSPPAHSRHAASGTSMACR